MIGADDLASFFDPEEFGCRVLIITGAGQVEALGMWGDPAAFGRLQRPSVDKGAAQISVRAAEQVLQLPNEDVPRDWQSARIVEGGVEWACVKVAPCGRLRSLLTLVPYADRGARAKEGKSSAWLPSQPRNG